jgi:thiol:disulfide interchange protein
MMRLRLTLLLLAACVALPVTGGAAGLWHDNASAPDILPVDQAFQLQPVERVKGHLQLSWLIAKGYYLYRERIHVEAFDPLAAKLGKLQLPPGEKHHDEHFGDVQIYRGGLISAELYASKAKANAKLRKLKVSYQGCAESGVCYPPQTRIVDIPSLPDSR